MPKIKPCPFCGDKAELKFIDTDTRAPVGYYVVQCYACDARGTGCGKMGNDTKIQELAIASWNQRDKTAND